MVIDIPKCNTYHIIHLHTFKVLVTYDTKWSDTDFHTEKFKML